MKYQVKILSFFAIVSTLCVCWSENLFATLIQFEHTPYKEGYDSQPSNSIRVDLRGIHGSDCKNIASTKTQRSFISTKTATGWNSFKAHMPPGLTFGSDCLPGELVDVIGTDWERGDLSHDQADFYTYFTTLDSSGNIYVIDTACGDQYPCDYDDLKRHRVVKYSSTGVWLLTIGGYPGDNNLSGPDAGLHSPSHVAVDSSGNIWIADTGNYKVKKYSSTGAWLLTIGSTQGDSTLGGANDQFFAPAYIGGLSGSEVAVIDYFGTNNSTSAKVKRFSSTGGAFLGSFGMPFTDNQLSGSAAVFDDIVGFYVSSADTLRVHDSGNMKMLTYTSTGVWQMTVTGTVFDATATWPRLRVKNDQRLYYADCAGYCLRVYTSTGQFIAQIGTGTSHDTFNDLSSTSAVYTYSPVNTEIVVNSGVVYIADTLYSAIKIYTYTGMWIGNIGSSILNSDIENDLSDSGAYFPRLFTMTVDNTGSVYVYFSNESYWSLPMSRIKKYSSTGMWLMNIGGTLGDNDLSDSSAMIDSGGLAAQLEVGDNGNIYALSDRIKIYSLTGTWLATIGNGVNGSVNLLSGRSAGSAYSNRHIVVDHSGSVYLHSYYRYTKYSSTGGYLLQVGAGGAGSNNLSLTSARMGYSEAQVVDSANSLYLIDYDNNFIRSYSSTGSWLMTLGSTGSIGGDDFSGTGAHLSLPVLIVKTSNTDFWPYEQSELQDSAGNWYFLDGTNYRGGSINGDQIRKYSATGSFLLRIGNGTTGVMNNSSGTGANFQHNQINMNGFAVDGSGNLWLGSGKFFKKYSSTGQYLLTLGSLSNTAGDNNLSGTSALLRGSNRSIVTDSNGSLYVGDVGNEKVKKYSSTGQYLLTIDSGGLDPSHFFNVGSFSYTSVASRLAFLDPSGNILIGKTHDHVTYGPHDYNEVDTWNTFSTTGAWMRSLGGSAWSRFSWNELSGTAAMIPKNDDFEGSFATMDHSGNIWVYNYFPTVVDPSGLDPVFKKYSSTGQYLLTLGDAVNGDNALSGTGAEFWASPEVVFDKNNSIYLKFSDQVKKYSSDGMWIFDIYFDRSCSTGQGVMIDTYGNMSAYDCTVGNIVAYNSGGSLDASIPDPAISYDVHGNSYVASGSEMLLKYSATGALLMTLGQGIAGDNNLSGTSALFYGIDALSIDSDENIYFMTYNTGAGAYKIKKYSNTGQFLMSTGGTHSLYDNVSYFSLDSNDRLHVVIGRGYGLGQTYMYGPAGDLIATLGAADIYDNVVSGTGAGLGYYLYQGIDPDLGYLWVYADNRVKRYRP